MMDFVRVYSELEKGTKFAIYLPAQTDAAVAPRAEPAVEPPHGHDELILVVDDELAVRLITQQTLESFGYRVVLASDGAEAVAIFATQRREIDAGDLRDVDGAGFPTWRIIAFRAIIAVRTLCKFTSSP